MIRGYRFLFALAVFAATMSQAEASDYSDLVQSHGPVAYWRLGEASGTTAVDTTGAHDGTYQNSVTLGTTGAISSDTNQAASFGGAANDRVQINAFGVSGSGITILAWFKPSSFGDDRFLAKATGNNLVDTHWSFGTDSRNRLKAQLKISGTSRELMPSVTSLIDDVWYFGAFTYDGTTMRVYLEGALVGSAAYTGTVSADSTVAVALGNLPAGAGNRAFNGALDEVALFDKELTAAQILALYTTAGGGLRGHWKLTETSGTTATDSSPQQNNGTYTNGVVLASSGPYPGPGNKAANFDGSDDYVTLPNEKMYDLTDAITVAAWIKVDAFDETDQAIVTKGNNAWSLQRDGNNNGVSFYCRNLSTETIVSSVDVNDGHWHYVAGVYTGSQLQLYVDGILSNSVSSTGSIRENNRAVDIGRSNQGGGREFDGLIHDVRIYSRALSATEVAELYGLIGHWKLDETGGSVAVDSSGMGRNGTVIGTAIWTGGAVDNALQLAGSTRVQIPGLMKNPKSVSLAAWANLTAPDSGGAEVISIGDYFTLRLDEGTLAKASFHDGSTRIDLTQPQTFTGTGWHHFAVVFNDDDNSFELYVNGTLMTSTNTASSIAYTGLGTNTQIGSHGNGQTDRDFTGKLDDVRIYNRAIGSAEIQKLYHGGDANNGVRIIRWVEIQ